MYYLIEYSDNYSKKHLKVYGNSIGVKKLLITIFDIPILLQQLKTGLNDLLIRMSIRLLSMLIKLMIQGIL